MTQAFSALLANVARGYNAGADASDYRRMAEYHEFSARCIRALTPEPPSEKENEGDVRSD